MSHAETAMQARAKLAFDFAASLTHVAFPVRSSDGATLISLHDVRAGTSLLLRSVRSHLISPYLTRDGKRLIFVRQPFGEANHELISCDLNPLGCTTIVHGLGGLSAPTENFDGNILFSASPPHVGSDGASRFSRNDLWIVGERSRPSKVAELHFYQISALSSSKGYIYMSAFGPSPELPILPVIKPFDRKMSDIYRLPIDSQSNISRPEGVLASPIKMDGRSTLVDCAEDGSILAFLNADTKQARYRYELIVYDSISEKYERITSAGLGFSRPVVRDDHILAREILDRDSVVKRYDRSGKILEEVIRIDDLAVTQADEIELQIK